MAPREEPKGGRFRVLVVGAQAGGFGLLRARKRTSSWLLQADTRSSSASHVGQTTLALQAIAPGLMTADLRSKPNFER